VHVTVHRRSFWPDKVDRTIPLLPTDAGHGLEIIRRQTGIGGCPLAPIPQVMTIQKMAIFRFFDITCLLDCFVFKLSLFAEVAAPFAFTLKTTWYTLVFSSVISAYSTVALAFAIFTLYCIVPPAGMDSPLESSVVHPQGGRCSPKSLRRDPSNLCR